MSYLALYRKYRPDTFDKIIGQEHIVKTLVNQIESGRLGHAYLFTGTRGTGKTTVAKIFARAINCLNPKGGSPCGECEACKALSDPSNIDVIEIDAASNNGVNEIRDLREKVQYPPVSCRFKVYIVDEVHMLTGAAFNALLKTLEEPPRHAVFILATTEVHKIPATILSRCMRFDFRLVPTARISKLICDIYDELGKEYDKEAINAIAAAGEGSVRDALSIADTALSYGKGRLTYENVTDILGSSSSEILLKFVKDILSGNTGAILNAVEDLAALGKSMGVLVKDLTYLVRSLLIVKTCRGAEDILSLPHEKISEYKAVADSAGEERFIRIMEIFSDAENSLRYTTHPRVVFETAAVKAARPECDYNPDALLLRIKELESRTEILAARISEIPGKESLNDRGADISFAAENLNGKSVSAANSSGASDKSVNSASLRFSAEGLAATNTSRLNSGREGISSVENPVGSDADRSFSDRGETKSGNESNKENISLSVTKKLLSEVTPERLKGVLLYNLRNNGHEMLWNVMQSVDVGINGNVIVLTVSTSGDAELIETYENKNCIEQALAEFMPFGLDIEISDKEKNMEIIDEETEKVKKIFGDDIVIVKE